MKKYKLIKWYPSLPKDWKIGIVATSTKKESVFYEINEKIFTNVEIQNNPEFWEEIIEKEYEILKISSKKENDAHEERTVITNNFKECDGDDWQKYWNIHSVKRLSDGEIFTIGDKVTLDNTEMFTGKIWKFEVYKDNINVFYAGFDYITDITKVKTPLFTTEDGVDIFGKYTLFTVGITLKVNSLDYYKINEVSHLGLSSPNLIDFKWFNLKENAEKYIEQNKPKYSENQITDIIIKFMKNEIKTT